MTLLNFLHLTLTRVVFELNKEDIMDINPEIFNFNKSCI